MVPRGLAFMALLLVVAMTATGPAASQVTADPTVAPITTLSADGRTVSGAGRTLTVSQATGLAPAGQSVLVSGSGFDVAKGVYLALCLIPPPNQPPSPCGGGADTTGASGASAWISSDPPSYASGLAQPYGPGGSFAVDLTAGALLGTGLDCRLVQCAIVSRNDHTRSADRSQDLFVPVSFAADPVVPSTLPPASAPTEPASPVPSPPPTTVVAPPTSGPPTTGPPTTEPPTTTTPPTTATPLEWSEGGRAVSDGTRRVAASAIADLDPVGAAVTVQGDGFDERVGVYVGLCRWDEENGDAEPCVTGASRSAWLSSDPPPYGEELAEPYEPGGRFEVELVLEAHIDDETDCRQDPCALVVRDDDTVTEDRSPTLAIPVHFASTSPTTDAPTASAEGPPAGEQAAGPDGAAGTDPGGPPWSVLLLAGGLAIGLAIAAVAVIRRRAGEVGSP